MPTSLERDEFIKNNQNLVHKILHKHFRMSPANILYEDYFQEGVIGLIKAYDNFKPELGFAFSTYAYPMIIGQIQRYRRDTSQSIHYSRSLKDKMFEVMKLTNEGKTPAEVMSEMDLTIEDYNAISDMIYGTRSLDFEILAHSGLGKQDSDTKLSDIVDSGNTDIQSTLDMVHLEECLSKTIQKVYSNPSLRDTTKVLYKDVYEEYIYGSLYEGQPTQQELAEKYKVSQAQVSRILKKMNNIMSNFMEK